MDAIIMPLTPSLASLRTAYPQFDFKEDVTFYWSPTTQTIHSVPDAHQWLAYTLHELSHALLGHTHYTQDIRLLAHERDAWEYATSILAPSHHTAITDDLIQSSLDTYRDWLHRRSTCPNCQTTGIQSNHHTYQCLACLATWRVNEARSCTLRRQLTPIDTKNSAP
jgi:hypothetical protein